MHALGNHITHLSGWDLSTWLFFAAGWLIVALAASIMVGAFVETGKGANRG